MVSRTGRRRRISEPAVARLPIYQRIAADLLRSGQQTVSSAQLGRLADVTAAKVRKDLSAIGSLGTRGTGYDAVALIAGIDAAMGAGRTWRVVVAGAGNLGRALVSTSGFLVEPYELVGLVDSDPSLLGELVSGHEVTSFEALEAGAAEPVDIGVICVPGSAAQLVADRLVGLGARSLLNFAPRVLSVGPEVHVRSVDLSIELKVLSHHAQADPPPAESPGAGPGADAGPSGRRP